MDRLIAAVVLEAIASRVERHHFFVDVSQSGNLDVSSIAASQAPTERFEGAQDIQHVANVMRGELADDCASSGDELDQAFTCQIFERLAQRCTRHPQRFAELPFVNAGQRRKLPFDNHVAYALDKIVVQRASGQRNDTAVRGGGGENCLHIKRLCATLAG